MQRRKAIATAGALTMTAAAATFAMGANFGAFGLSGGSSRPHLVSHHVAPQAPVVEHQTIDIPEPDTSAGGAGDVPEGPASPGTGEDHVAPTSPSTAGHVDDSNEQEHEVEHPEAPESAPSPQGTQPSGDHGGSGGD